MTPYAWEESKMPDCTEIEKLIEKTSNAWILVENEKHDIAWVGVCPDKWCTLCTLSVGNTILVPPHLNNLIFGVDYKALLKVTARMESIWE